MLYSTSRGWNRLDLIVLNGYNVLQYTCPLHKHVYGRFYSVLLAGKITGIGNKMSA